jgi:putative transposase
LGASAEERQQAYAGLFASYADADLIEEIRAATNGGYAFGDARFRAAMTRALGRRVERGRPGRPSRTPEDDQSQEELSLQPSENVVCP